MNNAQVCQTYLVFGLFSSLLFVEALRPGGACDVHTRLLFPSLLWRRTQIRQCTAVKDYTHSTLKLHINYSLLSKRKNLRADAKLPSKSKLLFSK